MSNIKKVLVVAVCVLIVSLPSVFAQGKQMMGKDSNMGMMGMRGGMIGKGSGMKMWDKMDFEQMFNYNVYFILMNSKDLGLTDEQTIQVKGLRYSVEKASVTRKAEIETIDIDIMQAFGKDNIDVLAIGKLIDKRYETKKVEDKEMVEACASLRDILTMEQQKKLKELWSTHMADGMKRMMKGQMTGTMMDDKEEEEAE